MKVGLYAATIAINSLKLNKNRWKNGKSLWILEGMPLHMLCVEIWLIYYSVPVNQPPPRPFRKLAKIGSQTLFKRHDSLASHLSRGYNYERALSEDPKLIKGWLDLVRNTIQKYGIIPADIWNFDETGFAMVVMYFIRLENYHTRHRRTPVMLLPPSHAGSDVQ